MFIFDLEDEYDFKNREGTAQEFYCYDCDVEVVGRVTTGDNYEREVVCPGCRQAQHVLVEEAV